MCEKVKYLISGDSALNMEFGSSISEEVNKKIRAMALSIEVKSIHGIVEMVSTYRSLMIHYDPLKVDFSELVNSLKKIEQNLDNIVLPAPEVIEIPTLYGGDWGPDLDTVASYNNITVEKVVEIHTSKEYLIFMLGFTPGFPYLGGMDKRIAAPRLQTPRTRIPGGSVGIAGEQTGIYPVSSPGGWQLIGRTPIKLFDPYRKNPILLKSGNYIKFKSINEEDYKKIESELDNGTYEYIIYPKKDGVN
jgi:KipI family sensor histidine kinase inhibitor